MLWEMFLLHYIDSIQIQLNQQIQIYLSHKNSYLKLESFAKIN